MEENRKCLSIEIDYTHKDDAIRSLEKIIKQLRMSIQNHDRQMIGNTIIEWGIQSVNYPDYRIEDVNGNQCMVLPSKMNYE